MNKIWILAVFVAGLINLGAAERPAVERVPDFTLTDLEGRKVRFSSFQNKVVLLNFWATWCPPCQDEIPSLKALYSQYKSKGVEVIGIALDDEGVGAVKPFVQMQKINYPIFIGDNGAIKALGGIRGIPTTFLISRDSRIIKKYVGEQRRSDFEVGIEKLIG